MNITFPFYIERDDVEIKLNINVDVNEATDVFAKDCTICSITSDGYILTENEFNQIEDKAYEVARDN